MVNQYYTIPQAAKVMDVCLLTQKRETLKVSLTTQNRSKYLSSKKKGIMQLGLYTTQYQPLMYSWCKSIAPWLNTKRLSGLAELALSRGH